MSSFARISETNDGLYIGRYFHTLWTKTNLFSRKKIGCQKEILNVRNLSRIPRCLRRNTRMSGLKKKGPARRASKRARQTQTSNEPELIPNSRRRRKRDSLKGFFFDLEG